MADSPPEEEIPAIKTKRVMDKCVVQMFPNGSVSMYPIEASRVDEVIELIKDNTASPIDPVTMKPRSNEEQEAYLSTLPNGGRGAVVAVIDDAVRLAMDRTFREAWTWATDAPVIDIDMEKAKQVHVARLREERAAILADLDVAYQRADESGDAAAKAKIAAEKQVLRDITEDPRIAAATTPDDLKKIVISPIDK